MFREKTEDGTTRLTGGSPTPPGSLIMFAGNAAPPGWLVCNGAVVSRAEYSDLFAAIGTAYGAGDGSTTFKLPDMRNRMPLGSGLSSRNPGSTGGAETTSISGHTHTYSGTTSSFSHREHYNTPGQGSLNKLQGPQSHSHTYSGTTSTGGASTVNTMDPWLAMNFIIRAV